MRFSSPPVNVAQQGGAAAGSYGFGGMPNANTFSTMGAGATTGAQPYLTSVGHSGLGNPEAAGYGAGAYAAPTPGLHGNTGAGAAGSPSSGYMNPMGMNMGGFGTFGPGAGGQWPMGMNDATAQMGMQFGKSAVAAGQDYVEKNVSSFHSPFSLHRLN